eukprot:CCRYP_006664-RB/>CCRYP_006664-RB protein AED:0.14 eAED:0.14 QI:18/1/1/1/0.5/0.33/3/285/200
MGTSHFLCSPHKLFIISSGNQPHTTMQLDLTPKESTPWWSLLRCCRPSDVSDDKDNHEDPTEDGSTSNLDSMDVVVVRTPPFKCLDSYSTPLTDRSTPHSSLHVILEDGHETADDQTSSASSINFLLDDEDDDDDSIANHFPLDTSPYKVSNFTNGTFMFLTLAAAAATTTTNNLRKRRLFNESSDFEYGVVDAMGGVIG